MCINPAYAAYAKACQEAAAQGDSDFLSAFAADLQQTVQQTQDDVADIWPAEPISWAEFKGDF